MQNNLIHKILWYSVLRFSPSIVTGLQSKSDVHTDISLLSNRFIHKAITVRHHGGTEQNKI